MRYRRQDLFSQFGFALIVLLLLPQRVPLCSMPLEEYLHLLFVSLCSPSRAVCCSGISVDARKLRSPKDVPTLAVVIGSGSLTRRLLIPSPAS